jgi:S-(hydroxymethyl)glutathione dehydrogenase/alcohol dehydrogenase
MKSRAAVLFEPGKPLEICSVDVQDPKAGEVRIEIKAAGVCHTDLSVMTGSIKAPIPAILGHEGAGIVVDVGPGVTAVKPGDHVIPLWRLSCGHCEYCNDRRPALCGEGTEIRSMAGKYCISLVYRRFQITPLCPRARCLKSPRSCHLNWLR